MSLRKELIAAGQPIGESIAVGGSTDLGVTVTTAMTTQANGYSITKTNTIVATSGATGNAMTLPQGLEQGDLLLVANLTANALTIFPPLGWQIHGAAVNASYSLAAQKTAYFSVCTNPDGVFPQGGFSNNVFTAQQG